MFGLCIYLCSCKCHSRSGFQRLFGSNSWIDDNYRVRTTLTHQSLAHLRSLNSKEKHLYLLTVLSLDVTWHVRVTDDKGRTHCCTMSTSWKCSAHWTVRMRATKSHPLEILAPIVLESIRPTASSWSPQPLSLSQSHRNRVWAVSLFFFLTILKRCLWAILLGHKTCLMSLPFCQTWLRSLSFGAKYIAPTSVPRLLSWSICLVASLFFRKILRNNTVLYRYQDSVFPIGVNIGVNVTF